MKNVEIQRLYHQIENELSTFRNELKKLSVPNYPTQLGKEIISKLHEKVQAYEELLNKIMSDIGEDEEDEKIINECKDKITTQIHAYLVKEDVKFLNWLNKAQTKKVPWSFVNCIEKLGKQVLPEKQILVCCDDRYNYGICWAKDTKVAPHPYYVVSLPLLHRTNILWHALIGHELFHPKCSDFIDKHNKRILTEIRDEVEKKPEMFLPSEEEGVVEPLFQQEKLLAISNTIHRAWVRGLQEILCDMACVEIFGPAGLLAMNSFSACSPQNTIPDPANNFYPSWKYRFEIVWKNFVDEHKLNELYVQIENKEISKLFQAEMKKIKTLAEKSEGDKLVKSHRCAKIAYTKIDETLDDAVKFVKDTVSVDIEKWYDTEALTQVPELVRRLENGIPPNEVVVNISSEEMKYCTKAATLPAILTAGWIYESYWQKKFNHQDKNIMRYETMSRLLLKACEDINIISNIQNVSITHIQLISATETQKL